MKLLRILLVIAVFTTGIVPLTVNNAMATGTLYGIAYVGGGPSSLYVIDTSTGAPTLIGAVGFDRCSAMDFDAARTLWAVCNGFDSDDAAVITINTATGAGTKISSPPESHSFGSAYSDMSFRNGDGKLYVYLESGDGVGTLVPTTGALTELGASETPSANGNGIAFTLADTLYHATEDPLNTLDQTSGAATTVASLVFSPPLDSGPRINAMDLDSSTGVMYGSCNDGIGGSENYLCTIDLTSGTVTVIGATVNGLDAIAFASSSNIIGGNLLPIDNTALLLAGIQSSSIWMVPTLAGLAGVGAYYFRTRMSKE